MNDKSSVRLGRRSPDVPCASNPSPFGMSERDGCASPMLRDMLIAVALL